MPITQEDLLEEVIAKLNPPLPPGAFTEAEFRNKAGGAAGGKAAKFLRKLVAKGELAEMTVSQNGTRKKVYYKPKG